MDYNPDSFIILWNNDIYAKLLSELFGSENVITSLEELEKLNFNEKKISGAVILIELTWVNRKFSQLYGIEIAKTFLRVRKKVKFPILFTSFLSLRQILLDSEGNKKIENQIVGAIGHNYLRLPVIPENFLNSLKQLKHLNELQFADVFNNLCNLKGLVGGQIHELQGKIRSLAELNNHPREKLFEIFEKGFVEISQLLKDAKITNLIQKFKADFQEKTISPYVTFKDIQEFIERCGTEISALIIEEQTSVGVEDNFTEKTDKKNWKVLLLDDEPDSLYLLQSVFKQRNVEYLLAQTVEEAQKIVEDDIYNEIAVAISDYRLLEKEDGIERHQRSQGYDFLLWLAAQNRFTHLVALSGLSRKFLLESFQKYNTRVDVYSKQDLMAEQAVHLFIDNVIDRGQEIYETICSRPTVGDWKSLKPFYAAHRSSSNYRLKEQEISYCAIQYIKKYEELLESRNIENLLHSNLENLSELTTRLAEKSPSDLRSREAFYNKLIARRIALLLHLKLGFSRNEIFAALKGRLNPASILLEIRNELKNEYDTFDEKLNEKIENKTHKKYKDNSTNLVTTNLALSFPVSANELLIEEKHWLKTEIGIRNFDSPFSLARQIPYFVQLGVDQFLEGCPEIFERFKEKNQFLFTGAKSVIVSFSDAKKIIQLISEMVASEPEKKDFNQLLKIIENNIRANIGDNQSRLDFLNFIGEFIGSNKKT